MRSNGALFMREAHAAGLDTGNSIGLGILPVMVGTSLKVGKITHRLFERGINASPIFSPGVPINAARLRYFVTSEHTPTRSARPCAPPRKRWTCSEVAGWPAQSL